MTEVQANKNIFHFELSSKPNVCILGITVSMWKHHDFETILNYNDVMIIRDGIGNGLWSIERAYYMGVNAYFGPRRKNRPHENLTMDLEI